jgi:hypothetical protein
MVLVTFITYSLTGHRLDAPTIFAGLQFFNILRIPFTYFPRQISALIDAKSALGKSGPMRSIFLLSISTGRLNVLFRVSVNLA